MDILPVSLKTTWPSGWVHHLCYDFDPVAICNDPTLSIADLLLDIGPSGEPRTFSSRLLRPMVQVSITEISY